MGTLGNKTFFESKHMVDVSVRQKQVDKALNRAFRGALPSGKCRAVVAARGREVQLYHYEHLLLVYDMQHGVSRFRCYERPTDKRVLLAAEETLQERHKAASSLWQFLDLT